MVNKEEKEKYLRDLKYSDREIKLIMLGIKEGEQQEEIIKFKEYESRKYEEGFTNGIKWVYLEELNQEAKKK